ncbi:MAG: zf-HC2 domain-containing protein [Clostridia bacterium]
MDESCAKFRELISATVDGEITGDEQAALDKHIASCPDCAAAFTVFSILHDETSSLNVSPPPELATRVMFGVRNANAKKPHFLSRFKFTAAAAVILLVVFVASGQISKYFPSEASTDFNAPSARTNAPLPDARLDAVVPAPPVSQPQATPKPESGKVVSGDKAPRRQSATPSKKREFGNAVADSAQPSTQKKVQAPATEALPTPNPAPKPVANTAPKPIAPTPNMPIIPKTEQPVSTTPDSKPTADVPNNGPVTLPPGNGSNYPSTGGGMPDASTPLTLPVIPYDATFTCFIVARAIEIPKSIANETVEVIDGNTFIRFDANLYDMLIAELTKANIEYSNLISNAHNAKQGLFIILA